MIRFFILIRSFFTFEKNISGTILSILIFSASFQNIFSQSLISYNYSVENGLPSSETYDIFQDSKGFIWVATDRGVCRYDGYSFRTFTTEDGLTDNTVFNLYEDKTGRIWFMTYNGKLSYFQNRKIISYKYNDKLTVAIPKASIIRSLCCSGDTLTIGYLIGGIVVVMPDGEIKKIASPTNPDIPSFYAVEMNNTLAFASYSTLKARVGNKIVNPVFTNQLYFKNKSGAVKIESRQPAVQINIRGLKRKNGNYVIYTPGKLVEIDPSLNYRTLNLPDKEVLQLFEDSENSLWISFRKSGVRHYSPDENINSGKYEVFFQGENISGICEDNEKGLWFSTLQNGIYFVPSVNYKIIKTEGNVNSDIVSVTGDGKEKIFYGDKNGKLIILTPDSFAGFSQKEITEKNNIINSILYDNRNNSLWCGGNMALEIFDKSDKSSIAEPRACKSMTLNENDNAVWQLAPLELVRHDLSPPYKALEGIRLKFRCDILFSDENGKLWIGANEGLYVLEGKDVIFCGYHDSLLRSRISDIKQMRNSKLILSTVGNGIIIKDGDKTKKISSKDGVCSNIINGIAVEGDTIWAATNKGLSRIELINDKINVINYNTAHGLPTDELRTVYIQNGKLWIGSGRGLVEVDKRYLISNSSPPEIYLSSVSVNDSVINAEQNDTLKIKYNDYLIRINFIGLSFKRQGKLNYKYVLHGLSNEWQYTTNTSVQFTSLHPGPYVFEVYAQNENGVWSTKPVKLFFNVLPPYWNTWWFISIIIILLGGIMFSVIFYRFNQLKNRNIMLEQIHNYKMQALTLQMNPHFLFNTLNSIQAYVLTEDKKNASKYLSKFAKLMRLELSNLQKEYIPLSNEVEMLNLYLELEELRFKNKFRFEIRVEENIGQEKILIPSMLIQPYLENSVKHGMMQAMKDPGQITARIFFENNKLICVVDDNGTGREAAAKVKENEKDKHESTGMKITEQRLKLLCANNNQEFILILTDKKKADGSPEGTRVEFSLPYKTADEQKK